MDQKNWHCLEKKIKVALKSFFFLYFLTFSFHCPPNSVSNKVLRVRLQILHLVRLFAFLSKFVPYLVSFNHQNGFIFLLLPLYRPKTTRENNFAKKKKFFLEINKNYFLKKLKKNIFFCQNFFLRLSWVDKVEKEEKSKRFGF